MHWRRFREASELAASGRALAWLELVLLVCLAALPALALGPEPFSDWQYYWLAAGNPGVYERGGAGLLLVSTLKALGMPAHVTMLFPNIACACLILLAARRVDPFRGKWMSHLVALYLLLLTPYFGIVQLDLLAAGFLVAGWMLVLRPPASWPAWLVNTAAVASFAAAVSTRPQFLLVLGVLSGLLVMAWIPLRRRPGPSIPFLAVVLLAGTLAGFALDSGLRGLADRDAAIRTNSAVTLYSGLLVSSTSADTCGHWSRQATEAMRADLGLPLADAAIERLRAQPARHWGAVMGCKLGHIILPRAFAWGWLTESPGVQVRLKALFGARAEGWSREISILEARLYRVLVVGIYMAVGALAFVSFRRRPLMALPLAWLLAFWLVHLVFEVQGRYFLATILLMPILGALAWSGSGRPGHGQAAARTG